MLRIETVTALLVRIPQRVTRVSLVVAGGTVLVLGILGFTSASARLHIIAITTGLSASVAFLMIELKRTRYRLVRMERRLATRADRHETATSGTLEALHTTAVELDARLRALHVELDTTAALAAETATARHGTDRLSDDLVAHAVARLVARGDVLDGYALAERSGALTSVDQHSLRLLARGLYRRGYLRAAADAAERLVTDIEPETDERLRRIIHGDLRVLRGEVAVELVAPPTTPPPVPGRIVHLVGTALPDRQSGYTIRTQQTALAQRRLGFDPQVVVQMGVSPAAAGVRVVVDGVPYHRVPGPARGDVPLDSWLEAHVEATYEVVRRLRPAVLHAASDFLNAVTARAIADVLDVPVVYESRGFWEETWLSRQARAFGWHDLAAHERWYGLPDAYRWRRRAEDRARALADRVVTLDDVMAQRILEAGVARPNIWIVPNAVDVDRFPVQARDHDWRRHLGFDDDTVVVGCVTSLVEYEGIDTLVAAVARLQDGTPSARVGLLVVGDGPEREHLERLSRQLDVADAVFTGQVPHDEVLRYYGAIDVFVVPRHPAAVCQLVTPLKPYEAFAAGRAVVLSDVRALANIARESGAAELFTAGDVDALAATLGALVADPARRQALATAGARWVRTCRTWAGNAESYAALYELLGVRPARHTAAMVDAVDARTEEDTARTVVLESKHRPYERFGQVAPAAHGVLLREGWTHSDHPTVAFDQPIDWRTACLDNRSWNFHLHAWDFMEPTLRHVDEHSGLDDLDWCLGVAASWASTFDGPDDHGTMAWYDMALGLRTVRLAYLVEQGLRARPDSACLAPLLRTLLRHRDELLEPTAFNPRNNHGVFVAIGGLALARRFATVPGMDRLQEVSRRRLQAMARQQFLPDGGHAEHSPTYHRMLLETFSSALDADLIEDVQLRQRICAAEDVLGWFVEPSGTLVQLGDTPARDVRASDPTSVGSPTTVFHLSRGRHGRPDDRTSIALHDTGFAAVRSPQPRGHDDHERASYLTLVAGFHSRVHKHADDLSLTWFDRGHELLIDAGRYGYVDLLPKDSPLRRQGYYYSAPERQYVESTRAHNTVELDGRDHERRSRRPYGSALRRVEERDGHHLLTAAVDHGGWRHERIVVLRPGRWLYVTDRVTASDGGRHAFRVWWNLLGEADVATAGTGRVRVAVPTSAEPLWIVDGSGAELIAPARGVDAPLRGWRSRRDLVLEPAWSLGFVAADTAQHEFRTFLGFGAEPLDGPPSSCPFEIEL